MFKEAIQTAITLQEFKKGKVKMTLQAKNCTRQYVGT